MTQQTPILYSYPFSPYSQKCNQVLALSGIEYRLCEQPPVLPRPDLVLLGINYRRIPLLAIGKDIYADSQAIIRYLGKVTGIVDPDHRSSLIALKVLGDFIFRVALGTIDSNMFEPDFIKDRTPVFSILAHPNYKDLRPHALGEMAALLSQLESDFFSNGKKWVLGDKVSLGDCHVAWAVKWTLVDINIGQLPGFGRQDYPQLYDWIDRYFQALVATPTQVTGQEAAKTIISSTLKKHAEVHVDTNDPLGYRQGEMVEIHPTDAEPTHPQSGKLIGLDKYEVVIELENGIALHLPRIGQRIQRPGETKL